VERLEADESARKETAAEELQKLVQGLPLKNTTAVRDSQVIAFRWPSVFKRYHIEWFVNPEGNVNEFATEPVLAERGVAVKVELPPGSVPDIPNGWLVVTSQHGHEPGLLKELARQALFVCGAETFGTVPVDELLRETLSTDSATAVELASGQSSEPGARTSLFVTLTRRPKNTASQDSAVAVDVLLPTQQGRKTIFSREVSAPTSVLVAKFASQAEQWSRDDFVSVLENAGFQRSVDSTGLGSESARVDDETVALLESLNPVSQVLALQSLAIETKQRVQSVEVLTATARSYAMLGSLIEPHWSMMHKAMKARGLLLAERAVRLWPKSSLAWQSRAYVRALVGLHDLAIADLETAESLGGGESPEWVSPVAAYCQWDDAGLKKLESEGNRLAMYFRLLAAEIAGSPSEQVDAARQLLEVDPDCWRAMASLSRSHAIGIGHFVNSTGLDAIHVSLPRLLSLAGELPANVQKLLDHASENSSQGDQLPESLTADPIVERSRGIIRILKEEPVNQKFGFPSVSWPATAAIVEDSLFQLATESLRFERFGLGIDPANSIVRAKLLLEDHPLVPAIEGFHVDGEIAKRSLQELSSRLGSTDLSTGAMDLYQSLAWRDAGLSSIFRRIDEQNDAVLPDTASRLSRLVDRDEFVPIEDLAGLASECPLALILRVKSDWEDSRDKAREWEKRYPDNVELLRELAVKYEEDRSHSDAERCYQKVVALSEEPSAATQLANFYWRNGDWEKERKALEHALELPAVGLEHASASMRIANGYMARGQWEAALPHALSSAESYSAWGLLCAADCYEGLEDWEAAEDYQRKCSERYASSGAAWYFWCRRTGHGSLRKARQLAEQTFAAPSDKSLAELTHAQAIFAMLEGDPAESYRLFRKYYGESPSSKDRFLVAIWANDLNLIDDRDKVLKELAGDRESLLHRLLANSVLESLVGKSIPLSEDVLLFGVICDLRNGFPTNNLFCVAEYLRTLGEQERANEWYRLCRSSPRRNKLTAAIAGHRLTQLGIPAEGLRPTEVANVDLRIVQLLQAPNDNSSSEPESGWIEQYREASQLAPELAPVHYMHGLEALRLHKYDEAIRELSTAIEFGPAMAELHLSRAEAHLAASEPARAIEDLEMALKLTPNHSRAHYQLALIFLTSLDDSVRDVERARQHLEAFNGHVHAAEHEKLSGRALLEAEAGHFDEAIRLEQAAIVAVSDNNRFLTSALSSFMQRQPYRMRPVSVPLLSSLPADGSWSRYRLSLKEKEERFEGVVEVRSVGQFEREGEILRAVEVSIQGKNDLVPDITYRIIVPEAKCGFWRLPVQHIQRLWTEENGEISEQFKGTPAWDDLGRWLGGPNKMMGRKATSESVNGSRGSWVCQVFTGDSELGVGFPPLSGSWVIRKSAEVPFAVVQVSLELLHRRPMTIELTLEDFGDGAKASMPDLVP
jgi:tetratricopeptide (TPR) repeat protein